MLIPGTRFSAPKNGIKTMRFVPIEEIKVGITFLNSHKNSLFDLPDLSSEIIRIGSTFIPREIEIPAMTK